VTPNHYASLGRLARSTVTNSSMRAGDAEGAVRCLSTFLGRCSGCSNCARLVSCSYMETWLWFIAAWHITCTYQSSAPIDLETKRRRLNDRRRRLLNSQTGNTCRKRQRTEVFQVHSASRVIIWSTELKYSTGSRNWTDDDGLQVAQNKTNTKNELWPVQSARLNSTQLAVGLS